MSMVVHLLSGAGVPKPAKRSMSREARHDEKLEFTLSVEGIRFFAYISFWGMCIFAILLTKFVTADILAAGPEDGSTCPPFQDGKGFDINEDSHLMKTFGFNNICVNWDYSPSRELTAMVYPLFEYSLLCYVVADFMGSWLNFKKGYISDQFFRMHCIFFPFMVVLIGWFRMIFVCLAYSNVSEHTAGFMGMQLALMMIVLYNAFAALELGVIYPIFGTLANTRCAIWTYLIGDIIISVIKFYLTAYVVFIGSYPDWAKEVAAGKAIGGWVDVVWMLFNAVAPLLISYMQAKNEAPLKISIDQDAPESDQDGSAEESEPLKA